MDFQSAPRALENESLVLCIGEKSRAALNPELSASQTLTSMLHGVANPFLVLWVMIPLNLLMARKAKEKPSPKHLLDFYLKIALTISMICLCVYPWQHFIDHGLDIISQHNSHNQDGFGLHSLWGLTGSYVFVLALVLLERSSLPDMDAPLFIFWCANFMARISELHKEDTQSIESLTINILHVVTISLQCLLFFVSANRKSKPEAKEKTRRGHPEDEASWLSDCFLHWTFGLILTGWRKGLEESDVSDISERDKSRNVASVFERNWRIEEFIKDLDKQASPTTASCEKDNQLMSDLERTNLIGTEKHSKDKDAMQIRISLFKVLLKTFGFKYFLMQFFKGLCELSSFVTPILMGKFMEYIQNRQTEHWSKGIGFVLAIFAFNTVNTIFLNRIWAAILRLQKRIGTSLKISVFKKALTVKNDCTKDTTTGEIVNLISDDCDRIVHTGKHLFLVFSTPLMVLVSMYLLYRRVGDAMFVGLAIILVLIPLNKYVGARRKKLQLKITKNREKRSKLMNEIINGIKVLKQNAWEPSFIEKVKGIRSEETQLNNTKSFIEGFVDCMFRVVPYLVKLASFAVYLCLGGHVDAARGFTTMHLFHLLNEPFSLMAIVIPGYMETAISIKRINKFLNGDDIPHDIVIRMRKGKSAINIDNGEFSWERNSLKPTLRDINVNIPKGNLVAVVGTVGCGKSSLLSAILGEMEKEAGDVEVQGSIAYVPQEAWTLNATLRENVLFGSQFEAQRYQEVLKACSLRHDINKMEAADRTEIGEKGINLSGGQKQRVSLARAVYNDADVYLLDDPLSAVDAHVGKYIFDHVISHKGILKQKTRVLVTHGIHWLPYVDSIIFIRDGKIAETGTYKELTSVEGALTGFLREILSHKTEESSTKLEKVKKKMMRRLNSINTEQETDHIYCQNDGTNTVTSTQPSIPCDEGSSERNTDISNNDSDDDSGWFERLELRGQGTKSGAFVNEEELEHGQVKKGIYLDYFRAIGYKLVLLFVSFCFIKSVSDVLNTQVLQKWTDDAVLANRSLSETYEKERLNWVYFKWFAFTGAFEVIFSLLFVIFVMDGTFQAATRLHNRLLYKVLRAPMSFFETTPTSRILIRFTKNIFRVDELGGILRGLIENIMDLCTFLTLILLYCPVLSLYLIPVCFIYFLLSRLHVGSMRQLRRLKSKYRSPIYQHFTETLNGRTSIRAYKMQNTAIKTMENKLDQFLNYDLWEIWVGVGYSLHTGLVCQVVGLATGIVSVLDDNITAGMVGIVTIYAEYFSSTLSEFLRLMSHSETELVSLEKVIAYTNIPSEADWEKEDKKPNTEWPSRGKILFENYQARHKEGQALILKGVDCCLEGSQKVGIVGRSGAGKSTLTDVLFRLLEGTGGKIVLDNENIADLGLHDLRSRINILPQEPVVFSGSLRMNLDPFGRNTDSELWKALRMSHMASFVEGLPNQLDHECGEGGKNMSVGQRQLLCLARTLLKKSQVLVLDEATAAVDMETDELIQKTIRTEFKDCTVMSIAHRLNTVMDYDKILVMDDGLVKEFDSPANLLADHNSVFYSMAKDANLVKS